MKIFSICFFASILLLAQVGLAQHSEVSFDEGQTSDRTLKQTLEMGDHSRFLNLLKKTGLESYLDQVNITFLVPDDSYFEELDPAAYQEMINNPAAVKEALEAHTLVGLHTEKMLAEGISVPTKAGHSVDSEMDEGDLMIDGMNVLLSDVMGTNFVIHVVDNFAISLESDNDDDMDSDEEDYEETDE